MALHTDPMQKLIDVIKAICNGVKYFASLDYSGISLVAYIMKSPIAVTNAYLKIVPY